MKRNKNGTDSKDTSGIYLKKDQENLAKKILQKEYNEKVISTVQKELSILEKYLSSSSASQISDLYDKLNEGRKRMLDPAEVSDEEYVKRWLDISYKGKGFHADAPEFYTQKMERVRSKSEIIIAGLLQKYNIPYRYEYPIQLKGMGTVFPDFTVLNIRKRKEIYIEHLGLLDDPEYRWNAMKKIEIYEKNDIYPGDNLIITYECGSHYYIPDNGCPCINIQLIGQNGTTV